MPNGTMTARDLVLRGRTRLLFKHPFFGYLALKLKFVETSKVPTFATDEVRMFYNPDFVLRLEKEQVVTAVAHEVMHCISRHASRRGSRIQERWNRACDYAINLILKANGLPEISISGVFEWLCDDQYSGMTAEKIYPLLKDEEMPCCTIMAPAVSGDQKDSSDDGEGADGSNQEPSAKPIDWKAAVVEARDYAKSRGSLPAGMEDLIDGLIHPPVNWRRVIRSELIKCCRNDWSYVRPNRRYAHTGMIMPIRFGYTKEAEVWCDSSGSIGSEDWKAFMGATLDIASQLKVKVNVGVCDAQVQAFYENVSSLADIKKVRFLGRGGTSFIPAFDHAKKRRPGSMIYFTDLYGSFPTWKPRWPVLWATVGGPGVTPPFGRVLEVPSTK